MALSATNVVGEFQKAVLEGRFFPKPSIGRDTFFPCQRRRPTFFESAFLAESHDLLEKKRGKGEFASQVKKLKLQGELIMGGKVLYFVDTD